MASPAHQKYVLTVDKVDFLRRTASTGTGLTNDKKQTIYHAALAVNVASWDAFINNIIKDFYIITSNPIDPKFNSIHTTLSTLALKALEKFNTPNWENTRNLLIQCLGYDPYSDWKWPAKNMAPLHVQERLNQILKVRHSFAHGFTMPSYNWNRTAGGKTRLTSAIILETKAFFDNLALQTNDGIKSFITNTFSITSFW